MEKYYESGSMNVCRRLSEFVPGQEVWVEAEVILDYEQLPRLGARRIRIALSPDLREWAGIDAETIELELGETRKEIYPGKWSVSCSGAVRGDAVRVGDALIEGKVVPT